MLRCVLQLRCCCACHKLAQIAVDRLEGKLRSLHTGIYSMREFVRAKESENNYKVLAHGLQQLAEEVNAGLRRALI